MIDSGMNEICSACIYRARLFKGWTTLEAMPIHTCPYKRELSVPPFDEELCDCCTNCERECADDI